MQKRTERRIEPAISRPQLSALPAELRRPPSLSLVLVIFLNMIILFEQETKEKNFKLEVMEWSKERFQLKGATRLPKCQIS